MAVTAPVYPDNYQPVYGNLVYRVTSDKQSTKFKLRFVFDVYVETERIARLKVTPQNESWGQVDIARILQAYLDSKPLNMGSANQNEPITKANWGWLDTDFIRYNVLIGEEYANAATEQPILYNGLDSQGDPVYDPTDTRYVFNGVKEWYDGKSFDMTQFYLNTTDLPDQYEYNADDHRFMTDQPRIIYVRPNEYRTLAAFNVNNPTDISEVDSVPIYAAYFEMFDEGNDLIQTGITHNLITNGGWRYNCSGNTDQQVIYTDFYKKYISYVGVGRPNLVDMGIGINPNTKYYRVSLRKSVNDAIPPTPSPTITPQPTPSVTSSPIPPITAPVPASATPTPSITPTPSPTQIYDCPVECRRYCVYNNSKTLALNMTYTQCYTGNSVGFIVPAEGSVCVCSCGVPQRVSGSTDYSTINESSC